MNQKIEDLKCQIEAKEQEMKMLRQQVTASIQ
jgi:hypothetical protein